MRQATARTGVFVRAIEDGAQYRFHAHLTRACAEEKLERASEMSPVWCGHKDVLQLNKCTSCQEK